MAKNTKTRFYTAIKHGFSTTKSSCRVLSRGFIRSHQPAKIATYLVRIYLLLPPTLSVFSLKVIKIFISLLRNLVSSDGYSQTYWKPCLSILWWFINITAVKSHHPKYQLFTFMLLISNWPFPLGGLSAGNHGSCIHHVRYIRKSCLVTLHATITIPCACNSQRELLSSVKLLSTSLMNNPRQQFL